MRICVYRWERGIRAGGLGAIYSAAVPGDSDGCLNRNALLFAVPESVLTDTGTVSCTYPICSQWRRVFVAGGLSVGISRSTINTANEDPSNLDCVPTLGTLWVSSLSKTFPPSAEAFPYVTTRVESVPGSKPGGVMARVADAAARIVINLDNISELK